MSTTKLTRWDEIDLYVADGRVRFSPDGDREGSDGFTRWLANTLIEYRGDGCITGYYLTSSCDPDAGPGADEIDWTGIDEAAAGGDE